MGAQFFKERRELPRVALNRLVRVKEESGKTIQIVGINYSVCGMALLSNVAFPFGEFIELLFRINDDEKEEMKMMAEVMQNFKEGNVYITGVKFVGELTGNAISN